MEDRGWRIKDRPGSDWHHLLVRHYAWDLGPSLALLPSIFVFRRGEFACRFLWKLPIVYPFHPSAPLIPFNRLNVNGRIRAREVRVIISATKQQLGIMKTPDALRRAQSLGLDLVEIAPTAN